MQNEQQRRAALVYHAKPRPGKIEVVPTKSYDTQRDLALAYSPGVAIPCLEIEKNKEDVYKYTNKGNLFNSNVLDFNTDKRFDIWHDRAVFHFLTTEKEVRNYIKIAENHIREGGTLIIGTFSENGPLKCSGLEISRYSVEDLKLLFTKSFDLVEHLNTDHTTPFNTIQNFNFCRFKKLK